MTAPDLTTAPDFATALKTRDARALVALLVHVENLYWPNPHLSPVEFAVQQYAVSVCPRARIEWCATIQALLRCRGTTGSAQWHSTDTHVLWLWERAVSLDAQFDHILQHFFRFLFLHRLSLLLFCFR